MPAGALVDEIRAGLITEAQKMYDEDIAACRAMETGTSLMRERAAC